MRANLKYTITFDSMQEDSGVYFYFLVFSLLMAFDSVSSYNKSPGSSVIQPSRILAENPKKCFVSSFPENQGWRSPFLRLSPLPISRCIMLNGSDQLPIFNSCLRKLVSATPCQPLPKQARICLISQFVPVPSSKHATEPF